MLSIVIPTYNERKNIVKLINRINQVCKKYRYEIIVVDDNSPDGTSEVVEKMKYKNLKLVKRNKKGLTSAILDGIKETKYNMICVMDADFSHDPKYIPLMIDSLKDNDVVIASRYSGGRTEKWPITRKIISYAATAMIKPLTSVKDPISGYIAFNKRILSNSKINEKAPKISLEILFKTKCRSVKEIPIVFVNRKRGKSTFMNINTILIYARQITDIYSHSKKRTRI